jgi:hypothetical protein
MTIKAKFNLFKVRATRQPITPTKAQPEFTSQGKFIRLLESDKLAAFKSHNVALWYWCDTEIEAIRHMTPAQYRLYCEQRKQNYEQSLTATTQLSLF